MLARILDLWADAHGYVLPLLRSYWQSATLCSSLVDVTICRVMRAENPASTHQNLIV